MLEELDGSRLAGTYAGDRLKKFHPRQQPRLDHSPNHAQETLPTLDDFSAADDNNLSDVPDYFPTRRLQIAPVLFRGLYLFLAYGHSRRAGFFICL